MDRLSFSLILVYAKYCNAAVSTAFGDQLRGSDSDVPSNVAPRAIRTNNPLYGPWLTPSAVPYRFNSSLSATDQTMVTNAMTAISTNMNNCIRFVPWTAGAGDFLQISATFENGTAIAPTCFSFPGRLLRQAGNGQKLGMIGGVDGCLDTPRSAMKYLVHALGLRNEYLRADRAQFLTVVDDSLLKPALRNLGLVTQYSGTSQVVQLTGFDIKSVTIPAVAKYVATGALYTVANPTTTGNVGDQGALSVGDCIGLKSIYPSCLNVACTDPYPGQAGSIPTNLPTNIGQAAGPSNVVASPPGTPGVIPGTPNALTPGVPSVNPVAPTCLPSDPTFPVCNG